MTLEPTPKKLEIEEILAKSALSASTHERFLDWFGEQSDTDQISIVETLEAFQSGVPLKEIYRIRVLGAGLAEIKPEKRSQTRVFICFGKAKVVVAFGADRVKNNQSYQQRLIQKAEEICSQWRRY